MAVAIKYQVYEILEKVSRAKDKNEKINILRSNNIMPLRDVLQGAFDERIQWNLPEGRPPFTPNNEESPPSTLLKQHLNFKYFVKGLKASNQLLPIRRERMFIDMLESIHPSDAEVVIAMINKKPPFKGITKKLVQEAFPDLIT